MSSSENKPAARPKTINRYSAIIAAVFARNYTNDLAAFEFTRAECLEIAAELNISLPKNPGDLIYSFRYRLDLPVSILSTAPDHQE